MTGWNWVRVLGGVGVGVVLGGLAVFLVVAGLDDADKYASVIGLFVGIAALSATVWGIVSGRPAPGPPSPQAPVAGPQRVERLDAGRDVDVVDTVRGNLRVGTAPPSVTTPPAGPAGQMPGSVPPVVPGEQEVRDVRATGAIRIIRGVDGDADISS
ncbi:MULTISPECIES: hypothetical protein [Micromonospora]|uniref:hypothetical protein n=1 Tax=Micromonospora TaxID=1873 RepID=UPI0012F853B0|nr:MULTISPECIES: hypothetical protein [Micromonospora]WFE93556.1 hypothetical protein O7612_19295 [Micromonospora sp. WMMD987]